MPVAVTCPSCKASFRAADHAIGKSVRCSKCQKPFVARSGPTERAALSQLTVPAAATTTSRPRQRSPLLVAAVFGASLGIVLGLFGLAGVWLYTERGEPTAVAQASTPPTAKEPDPKEEKTLPIVPDAKVEESPPEVKEPAPPPTVVEPTPKVELPTEAPKLELPKTEIPKTELPKTELPKTEIPKTEMPKTEAPVPPSVPSPPAPVPPAPPATETTKPPPPGKPLDPKVAAQVKTSLAWLVKEQKADGAWHSGLGLGNIPASVVTTSFATLSLMSAGDPAYDPAIHKGARYVIDNLFENKLPGGIKLNIPKNLDQSNWKIAIGGLFVCEYYAWRKAREPKFDSAELDAVLDRVVEEAFKRMEPSGGWGHTPTIKNPLGYVELEVVGHWMLASVGACQRLGRKVPADKVKIALKFVEDCCLPGQGNVGYSPRPGQKGMPCPTRTGGALFGFALLQQHRHPLYPRMVVAWGQTMLNSNEAHGSLCLGMLSSGIAARHLGEPAWKGYQSKFFIQIMGAGQPDGPFKHLTGKTIMSSGFDDRLGAVYNTAIYSLILQLDTGRLKFVGQRQAT